MKKLLSHITSPRELRKLSNKQLPDLAIEIRSFILDVISVKPGHLGASFGVVELSIALHYHYDTPNDLLIWDVGHQSYPHKLLTGRQDNFDTLRQFKGISGFPVREESIYDTFGTGHSSTSISAITGMALANRIQNKKLNHIAVIGDASLASGMAFEGLNHLGDTDLNVLIILNDNNIGIDPSVGALQNYLNHDQSYSGSFFQSLGFAYKGIVNGHDIGDILEALEALDKIEGPKILHLRTIKGKGFAKAEEDQVLWHSPGKFDKATGQIFPKSKEKTFANVIGETLYQVLDENPNAVVITPAMPTGSGLVKLMKNFPTRVWDVGIAEQHAVTFGAGLATQGMKPFVVIYSTFLQRAYDQVIHDVALQNLPVVFLIDRAGLVGSDGATHHGYFDIAFLNAIPNLTIGCPGNAKELEEMIGLSVKAANPWAIRYPKGEVKLNENFFIETTIGKAKKIQSGDKVAILSTGHIANQINEAIHIENISWFHFPFIKPLDKTTLLNVFKTHDIIHTYEEGVISGGFGSTILQFAAEQDYKGTIRVHGYPDEFIMHAQNSELINLYQLDAIGIRKNVL